MTTTIGWVLLAMLGAQCWLVARLERKLKACRGVNPLSGNPLDWGHEAVIEGLVEQRDDSNALTDQARRALLGLADTWMTDNTWCWCSHGEPVTKHSYQCAAARAVFAGQPAESGTSITAVDIDLLNSTYAAVCEERDALAQTVRELHTSLDVAAEMIVKAGQRADAVPCQHCGQVFPSGVTHTLCGGYTSLRNGTVTISTDASLPYQQVPISQKVDAFVDSAKRLEKLSKGEK